MNTPVYHDHTVPTVSYHGAAIQRLSHQFKNVTGPEQLRKCLRSWGLREVSPRQARFWAESTDVEKRLFCDMAKVSVSYVRQEWRAIPEPQRRKLWAAIGDAATWGERLRGRF